MLGNNFHSPIPNTILFNTRSDGGGEAADVLLQVQIERDANGSMAGVPCLNVLCQNYEWENNRQQLF